MPVPESRSSERCSSDACLAARRLRSATFCFERVQTMLAAEIVGLALQLPSERLATVDLHSTDRVAGATAGCEPEQGHEDRRTDDVQHELVVEPDRAEDVRSARVSASGDQPETAEDDIDDQGRQ